jgi:VanZ family protein
LNLSDIADTIASWPVSARLADLGWFVPSVQSVHIFAIAVVLTAVMVASARIAGLARMTGSARETVGRFTPWVLSGLVVLAVSGALLILIEPHRQLLNAYFQVKMVLLVLLLAALSLGSRLVVAGRVTAPRAVGMCAVGLLLAIIWCGRWIAYTQ